VFFRQHDFIYKNIAHNLQLNCVRHRLIASDIKHYFERACRYLPQAQSIANSECMVHNSSNEQLINIENNQEPCRSHP